MKLKSNVVIIIILISIFAFACIGIKFYKPNEDNKQEIVEDVMPESFSNNIDDEYNVPQEIKDLIVKYNDAYFKSMYTLNQEDTNIYFCDDLQAKISNNAIKLMVEARRLYDFDFTLTNAHYDLKITSYEKTNDEYHVSLLEDDYMTFSFLDGIESQVFDIECNFIIRKVNDEYKISYLDKVQGYYMMFSDKEDVETLDELYEYYYDRLSGQIDYKLNVLKPKAIETPYISDYEYDKEYDREKAVLYSYEYFHLRNDKWHDFSLEGGNCQNYASQCLYEGGIPMDYYDEQQWKYYGNYIDYDNDSSGRTRSWVSVTDFNEYARENEDYGLVADVDVNIYYAQPGDLIQVGISSVSHTTIVSKVVNNHVLVNSNSIDMKDFPVEAYTYPKIVLIKILGANK